MNVNELVGKTLTEIEISKARHKIFFTCNDGTEYCMYHEQDCCESVSIEDICGDINDLVGSMILLTEESTNTKDNPKDNLDESFTWTFYKMATAKGYVTIRWYGESNGYYSESVDFIKIEK